MKKVLNFSWFDNTETRFIYFIIRKFKSQNFVKCLKIILGNFPKLIANIFFEQRIYSSIFKFVLLILFFLNTSVIAQDGYSILPGDPLSPNAAEFSKYGSYPVNLVTGIPNINLPIYTINSGQLSVPITLSYHGSGIKVTQMATWVGLGWSLNAGGIISRNVRGIPDEDQIYGWMRNPITVDEMKNLDDWYEVKAYAEKKRDSHPDFFTYNMPNKAGKFTYRKSTSSFEPIPYDPIIIERNSDNTYTITDDDGTKYIFETKEEFLQEGPPFETYIQSWYLTKIISSDNVDTIHFNYVKGRSIGADSELFTDVFTRTFHKYHDEAAWEVEPKVRTTNTSHHTLVELSEIVFREGKIVFQANTPRQDYKGASLDEMLVYKKTVSGYELAHKFDFDYDYFTTPYANPSSRFDHRLKLESFSKKDIGTDKNVKTYQFVYNSLNPPSTRSLSQDFWGYYNGTTGSNLGDDLLPNSPPSHPMLSFRFRNTNVGGANRNASSTHMKAGILEKIIYPTKGYTEFAWEPNRFKSSSTISLINKTKGILTLYGQGRHSIVTKTESIVWPNDAYSNEGTLKITFSPSSNPGALDVAQRVILRNVTTGVNIKTWEHTGDFTVQQIYNEVFSYNPAYEYEIYALVDDLSSSYVDVALQYQKENIQDQIKDGGGLRIQSITSYDSNDEVLNKEIYTYKSPDGDGVGQVITPDRVFYNNYYEERVSYTLPETWCTVKYGDLIIYVASSNYPMVTYQGATTLYSWVTKTQYGNDTPNGKSVYTFDITSSVTSFYDPTVPGGRDIIDNTLSRTGLLKSEVNFKYDNINQKFDTLKALFIGYNAFNISTEKALTFWKKIFYQENVHNCIPIGQGSVLNDYGYMEYSMTFGVLKKQTELVKDYFYTNGEKSIIKSLTTYSYNHNTFPSSINTSDSRGMSLVQELKYPGDHTTTDPNKAMLNLMEGLNMIRTPYYKSFTKNSILINSSRLTFDNGWNSNPDFIKIKKVEEFSGSTKVNNVEIIDYDDLGNPIEGIDQSGVNTSYLWNYSNSYLVAKVVNSTKEQIAYTSFENGNSEGGWSYTNSVNSTHFRTGKKSHRHNTYNLTKSGLPSGSYVVTFWAKRSSTSSPTVIVNGVSKSVNVTDWTFFEVPFSGTSVTVDPNNVYLDEVRLYPVNAQMTTYTYDPLIGMTSQTDPAGITISYEYDKFGRLEIIKDEGGNVLQHNEYKYANQQ